MAKDRADDRAEARQSPCGYEQAKGLQGILSSPGKEQAVLRESNPFHRGAQTIREGYSTDVEAPQSSAPVESNRQHSFMPARSAWKPKANEFGAVATRH